MGGREFSPRARAASFGPSWPNPASRPSPERGARRPGEFALPAASRPRWGSSPRPPRSPASRPGPSRSSSPTLGRAELSGGRGTELRLAAGVREPRRLGDPTRLASLAFAAQDLRSDCCRPRQAAAPSTGHPENGNFSFQSLVVVNAFAQPNYLAHFRPTTRRLSTGPPDAPAVYVVLDFGSIAKPPALAI